jgi:NitT/TauT family transport system permease protein/taurine transport system permease protein
MWSWRPLRDMIDPVIELTRPLPPLAFIPLLIVWFGIGELPKVVLILIGVLPIMIVSTVAALDGIPPELDQCARTLGASRIYTLFHVQLRAAVPGIITGMRLSMGGAWTSIVAVEMIAATSGVGFLILQAGNYLVTSLVLSGIIAIGVVSLVFDAFLRAMLRLADPSRAVSE